MASPFKLYPEERRWWSFQDYGAVLDVMTRLKPKRVLEFGPGSSTLALIEGGAEHIDSMEDDPRWLQVYAERLEAKHPSIVTLHFYHYSDPLCLRYLDPHSWDLALIDGPFGTMNRPAALRYCLPRCAAVLMPTEDHPHLNGPLRTIIAEEAQKAGRAVEFTVTGPLSGGFALIQ